MSTAARLPSDPVAPWAEVVPGHLPVAVDILLSIPDDGYRYEVVEGVLVRVAGSGEDIVPGFAHPVADVFADPLA